MIGLHRELPDPGRDILARRPFTFGGRQFERGDVFDWRDLGCDVSHLRRLFESGRLMNAEPGLPRSGVICRRPMSFGGRHYEAGEAFDYVEAGCSELRFKQLLQARKVVYASIESAPSMKPGAPSVTHTGSGWYTVTLGDRSERVRGADEAQAMSELMAEEAGGGQG